MSEEQEITVPAFIVTKWDEDGEPSVYKPIGKCTAEEIRAHVFDLRRRARTLQDEIVSLALYATGSTELVDDTNNDTPLA